MAERSFFGKLFDFSFTEFITTDIIKILFGLAIFFSGLGALMIIISGFRINALLGILFLLLSPLVFLLYVMASRVALEVVMVLFRIEGHTRSLASGAGESRGTGGPGGNPAESA